LLQGTQLISELIVLPTGDSRHVDRPIEEVINLDTHARLVAFGVLNLLTFGGQSRGRVVSSSTGAFLGARPARLLQNVHPFP
jgi:hypothetical protein